MPRRVSGPTARRHAATPPGATLPVRALAIVRGLPDHSLIDRLVRGRAWIPVLGMLLAGIVAMQVEILKLGASMGRSLQRTSVLQSQNQGLQAGVAGLADDQRIERLAAGMGMVMPPPSLLKFVSAGGGSRVGRALANIHAPDPVTFAAQLAAQLAAATSISPATTTASPPSGASAPAGAAATQGVTATPAGPAAGASAQVGGPAAASSTGAGSGAAALPVTPSSSTGSPPGG